MTQYLNMDDLGLAPMEGVTDLPARLWFGLVSAPMYQCSPFLRLTETFPSDIKEISYRWAEVFSAQGSTPYLFHPQVMASSPRRVVEVSEMLGDQIEFIELNCGCPAPLATAKGAGSSLLKDPDTFISTILSLSEKLGSQRLAVKMRTGYDHDQHFQEIVKGISEAKLRHLVIHGRTKEQGYAGLANWDHIGWAALEVPYPVIGSGDIQDIGGRNSKVAGYQDVRSAIVGRGAIRNPWIFSELRLQKRLVVHQDSLIFALAIFAILHDWYHASFERLTAALEEQLFAQQIENSPEAWKAYYSALCSIDCGLTIDPFELQVSRGATKRLKQLWRSLRTNLSPEMMNQSILKEASVGGMLRQIHFNNLSLGSG